MSLPDGAEYWWDIRGWSREMNPGPKNAGVRCCPLCPHRTGGPGTIRRLRRHYREAHGYNSDGIDFPLEVSGG